jgi:tripartite-type tricarboxylate transporter receptor subunit TctC
MTYVPYKSTSSALQDLLGGQVDAMFVDLGNGLAHMRSGAVRPLATGSSTRPTALPQVPTLEESGFPGLQMTGWSVLAAPAGVPQPIVQKLNGEVRSIMTMPEVAKVFTGNGSEIVSMDETEANGYVRSEIERWRNLMARSGIKQE